MSVDITDQGYTVVVEEETNEVTVVAPGAAGALGYYGAFFSDQDQQAAGIDTATAMTLNNTVEANGISIVSNSRITFAYDGTFDLQFSAQLHHRGGGGNGLEIDIWLAKNGSPVADTASRVLIPKNNYEVAAWDFLLTLASGDYLELMYQVTNTDIVIEHRAADGTPVDTPSLIVNVMQVMYNQVGPQGPTGATGATGPKGDKGDTGDPGAAATIAVGTTSTLSPGSLATVTNSGTSSAAVFSFGIPAGVKGDKGDKGDTGDIGPTGTAATIAVGTTSTLSAGSSATVTNSGTSSAAVFDFGIPQGIKGDKGDTGATGATGATGPKGDKGDTGAGVAVGGTTGQVLAKKSNTDYDTEWVAQSSGAPTSASYVVLGANGSLSDERVLTAGTGITVSDAGAGSTVTVATSALLPTLVDAKGDLLVGSTNDSVSRLAVGSTDGHVLTVDAASALGVKWAAVPSSPVDSDQNVLAVQVFS